MLALSRMLNANIAAGTAMYMALISSSPLNG